MYKDIVLDIKALNHWFPGKNGEGDKHVLHDVNLEVLRGQFTALVGHSGCGKTTLFKSILGTHPPKKGTVVINDQIVKKPNRNVGIVYQHYSLYDFLTAEENIAFGLMLDETTLLERALMPWSWWPKKRKHLKEAKEWLDNLGLGHAIGSYPHELSGGMRQRVAIGQALIMKPAVILLDEPFGALDETTREELQKMLLSLYQENLKAIEQGEKPPYTVFMVTHELDEAFYIADRIIGLSKYWHSVETNASGNNLGATICYDKKCPVYHPEDIRNFNLFREQKKELKEVVFSRKFVDPRKYRTFWSD